MSISERGLRGPRSLKGPGQRSVAGQTRGTDAAIRVVVTGRARERGPVTPVGPVGARIFGKPQLGEGTFGELPKRSPGTWRSDLSTR